MSLLTEVTTSPKSPAAGKYACQRVLVALPGLGGNALSIPDAVFENTLEDGIRVFVATYDVSSVHSMDAMGNAVWRAIMDAGIDTPVVLLGYSMGGFVAQAMYAQAPTRVAGIVLLASTSVALEDVIDALLAEDGNVHVQHALSVKNGLHSSTVPRAGIVHVSIFYRQVAAVFAYVIANDDLFLRTVACPVLAVYGSKDTVISVRSIEKLRSLKIPFREVVLQGADHSLVHKQSKDVSTAVAAWAAHLDAVQDWDC